MGVISAPSVTGGEVEVALDLSIQVTAKVVEVYVYVSACLPLST